MTEDAALRRRPCKLPTNPTKPTLCPNTGGMSGKSAMSGGPTGKRT